MKHILTRLVVLMSVSVVAGCGRDASHGGAPARGRGQQPYQLSLAQVVPADKVAPGSIGVMFCVDVSPSMNDRVGGERKIDVSKAAMKQVLNQINEWSHNKANANKPIKVGLIAFSGRADVIRPLETFDKGALERAVDNLKIGNATAIGDAMILGSQELLRSGVESKALIVLTDGENNRGVRPDWVMQALKTNSNTLNNAPTDDVKVFLLAFDIQASKFNEVKSAGAMVLESKDKPALEKIMSQTVEEVLLEKPR